MTTALQQSALDVRPTLSHSALRALRVPGTDRWDIVDATSDMSYGFVERRVDAWGTALFLAVPTTVKSPDLRQPYYCAAQGEDVHRQSIGLRRAAEHCCLFSDSDRSEAVRQADTSEYMEVVQYAAGIVQVTAYRPSDRRPYTSRWLSEAAGRVWAKRRIAGVTAQ